MNTPNVDAIEKIQAILIGQGYHNIKPDGDIGRVTRAAVVDLGVSDRKPAITAIQQVLIERGYNLAADGIAGPRTMQAVDALDEAGDIESLQEHRDGHEAIKSDHHHGKASFFAGPQDIAGFRKCKQAGGSDVHCFGEGDNGVGAWGMDCTSENKPLAAVPREVWRDAGKKGGARLSVTYNGKTVEGQLGDTMPALANVHNGACIDLNPGFAVAFGVKPSAMNDSVLENVTWDWVD